MNDAEFDRRLPGVCGAYRDIVRSNQPYARYPREPAASPAILLDALTSLADLSNRDKHRVLNVVAMQFSEPWVGVSRPALAPNGRCLLRLSASRKALSPCSSDSQPEP